MSRIRLGWALTREAGGRDDAEGAFLRKLSDAHIVRTPQPRPCPPGHKFMERKLLFCGAYSG